MENCLVTKLNVNVSNNDLRYLNAYKVIIDTWSGWSSSGYKFILCNYGGSYYLFGGAGVKVNILSNGKIYHGNNIEDGTELVLPDTLNATRFIMPDDSTKPTEILLTGLDKISSIMINGKQFFDTHTNSVEPLAYMSNLTYLPTYNGLDSLFVPLSSKMDIADGKKTDISIIKTLPNTLLQRVQKIVLPSSYSPRLTNNSKYAGEISNLNVLTNVKELTINDTGISGDISSLGTLIYLEVLGLYGMNVYGDLSFLSTLVNLKSLDIGNTQIVGSVTSIATMPNLETIDFHGTSISGAIEDMVAATDRSTGLIKRVYSNSLCTLNGSSISEGHHYIQWTSPSDITVGEGYYPE